MKKSQQKTALGLSHDHPKTWEPKTNKKKRSLNRKLMKFFNTSQTRVIKT